jgi:chromosome segregation protein
VEAARAERERLQARLETAHADRDSAREAVDAAEVELANLPEQPASDTDDGTRAGLVDAVEVARAVEIDARVVVEQARSKLGYQRDVRQGLDVRLEQEKRERELEAARAQERLAVHERALRVSALTPTLIQVANAALEESGKELAMLEATRSEADQSIQRLRSREAELRERLAQMTESVHNIEMHIYERNLHLTQLTERAQEELGLSVEVLLGEYGPDQPLPAGDDGEPGVFSREEQQKILQKAQRQLEQLGRVNPLALEEFQALEKRHQFLAEQLEDVLASKKDLLAIIDDIDETMRDVFMEAFEDTRNAFDQVFPVLFPGGQGSLSLTNPDDLLATGVEVAVRPKGKKIERLSLLSGGERSLAAVALLMAIFIARPSPFYILDEVEAALDDANLGRLLEVMEHLREGSQLIIITHQKRTMEIADALYGVSMRDDGVSAVVGQRVKESAVSA